ncbi:MAG: PAS domain S-box protein [Bacteroidota bacterium]
MLNQNLFFEHSSDLLCIVDASSNFIQLNPQFKKVLGYQSDELIGKSIGYISQNDDLVKIFLSEKSEFTNGFTCFCSAKNGDKKLLNWKIIAEENNLFYFIIQDLPLVIQNEKTVEKVKVEMNSIYKVIMENMADVISVLDMSLKTLYVSPTVKNAFGYEADEFILLPLKKLLTPESLKIVYSTLEEELENEKKANADPKRTRFLELQGYKKDGTKIWNQNNLSFLRDENNLPIGIISVSRDISQIKEAKIALEKSEEKYRKLIDKQGEGIGIVGENEVFTFVNSAACKIFGYSEEELLGKNLKSFVENETWKRFISQTANRKAGKDNSYEFEIIRKDGKKRILEISATPHLDENNNYIGTFGIFRDITEKKKLGEVMLKQQKELETQNKEYKKLNEELQITKEKAMEADDLKTAFLANMSHEIRTPLNGVIGFAELLKNPDLNKEDRELYISFINSSGNQLVNIITDIIDIAKIEANQMTINLVNVEINILAYETFLFFKESKEAKEKPDIELKMGFDPLKRVVLQSDPMRLQQIIFNLIRNAYKFTTHGFIEYGYSIKDDFLEFYVKDTGIGIPYEKQNIVFERFRQIDGSQSRKYGGSGLGLAIAKGLVEKLGGKIRLVSKPLQGTTFYFTIPYISPEKTEEKITKQIIRGEIPKESMILLAEDDFVSVQFIKEIFRNENVGIFIVGNGKDAVDFVAENESISLVLMDLNMPVLSGYAALREIKKIKPGLPVIAQTANAMSDDRKKVLDFGFDEYLAKPFTDKQLLSLVKSFLQK